MRHTASILVGQDLKLFAARLGKYVLKYGEGNAPSYFMSLAWTYEDDGKTEIKKAVRDSGSATGFVSTMQDKYDTKLENESVLTGADRALEIQHFFQNLHQHTVTINNPGDSSSLLLTIFLPLYDRLACEEAQKIITATTAIQSRYTVVIVGLTEDLGSVISPETFRGITAEEEAEKKEIQKMMLLQFAKLKLQQNTLQQLVVIQNSNSNNFALNLDQDSFLRIIGELSLLFEEKYNILFPQAASFDQDHPVTAIGLSVMNLDKYFFEDYLLRRSYIHILEREDVTAEEVDLNKVALVANNCLKKHQTLFSNFYQSTVLPLRNANKDEDAVIATMAPQLKSKLKAVEDDLTEYINAPEYSLPEKKAILAMILGYDDPLLKGNLFTAKQLTIDNLDEEVANCFIEANNACIRKDSDGDIIYGPLKDDGPVNLPLEELQKLRNDIRQSTNYIREKNKELEEIAGMTQDANESEKRLTENGFIVDGKLYRLDIKHEEAKFDETYQPAKITEKSVDLRKGFTKIKDQNQIGACTVFSLSSIFEYIIKQNTAKETNLSESFVYYNVRHAEGNDKEDTGSSFQDVIKSMGEYGICSEELHPYSSGLGEKPTDEAYEDGKTRRIIKALNVNVALDDIKSAIQEGYPVAVSLKIYKSFNSTSGFVKRPTKEEIESADFGYHAMVVVGYTDETKHFVVRNSWGESFGDGGYCYIPYSYISDPELNRMACIVTEIYTAAGGNSVIAVGKDKKKQIVQFNTSDARIKSYVIQNLLDEEELHLADMRKEDAKLKTEYETLMQTLGKQPMRTEILNEYMDVLSNKIADLKYQRAHINETERAKALRTFDAKTWKNKIIMTICTIVDLISWFIPILCGVRLIDWINNGWSWFIAGLFALNVILLILYWRYVKNQRRKLEMELEEMTAKLSQEISHLEKQKEEQKMKMHVAGMIIDELLTLKASLDKKYQGMKAYVGNLAIWHDEENKGLEAMEPIVKDPFIPLLTKEKLNSYFDANKDDITKGMHLYEYFKGFKLSEEEMVKYKLQLKQNILRYIESLLAGFTIFRHILGIRDYPFLDNDYASAERLLPVLDSKSAPFCLMRKMLGAKAEARFLFIHTDLEEEQAWKATYPQYFSTAPVSDRISSVYKIVGMRMQRLTAEEVMLG